MIAHRLNPLDWLIGPYVIDDEFIAALRSHVLECCKDLDLLKYKSRVKMQRVIEEEAKQAIVDMWAEAFPGRKYKIGRHWPGAACIVVNTQRGPYAVLELWIGHDYQSSDTPEPIAFYIQEKKNG